MAARKPASEATAVPDTDEMTERIQQLEQMQTTTLRILSRWIVRSATGQGAATLEQILVNELHIATYEEATAVTAWLTTRQ